ncbi:hypothetical protein M9Y10_021316 [Tritrichomonas musculus]|uniref:Uncharacterized protein n=1 Tax=Tritrichomonas musculus TaxID=1915356 RepID=A0ABR2HDP5_9EUKA
MLNLTIFSLSLASTYSISPFLSSHRITIQNSNLNHYFCSILILNPIQIYVGKSSFSHGFGSLLKLNKGSYEGLSYNSFDQKISEGGQNTLITFVECRFKIIYEDKNSGSFIQIYSQATFYMTNCIFDSCKTLSDFLNLDVKATTMSHICCSNLGSIGQNTGKDIFAKFSIKDDSFIKFIYSTFVGESQQDMQSKDLIHINGRSFCKFQCLNFSDLKVRGSFEDNTVYSLRLESIRCLSFYMNTLCNITASSTLFLSVKEPVSISYYVGYSNFIGNQFNQYCIYFDMAQNSKAYLDNCVFQRNTNKDLLHCQGGETESITVHECYFDVYVELTNCFLNSGSIVNTNAKLNDLIHFATDNMCQGDPDVNASVCRNGECPDNRGCDAGKFQFLPGDPSYEIKHDPNMDPPIPTPSSNFTYSIMFSESSYFTLSGKFSNSALFTNSYTFSISTYFSDSNDFSKTDEFTKTDLFSNSADFSETDYFSNSADFTKTVGFSKTLFFSDSADFTKTSVFSETDYFSHSADFSKTIGFTKSYYFSSSIDFSKSENFSKSDLFTKSKLFSETQKFSTSELFTKSFEFTNSNNLNRSLHFTKSYAFSSSVYFTNSEEYSRSKYFSSSINFTSSYEYTKSSDFTSSFYFSNTDEYTKSSYFSFSFFFTNSNEYTRSNYFSYSLYFSNSGQFTISLIFSKSNIFSNSDEIINIIPIKSSFSNSFVFSFSDNFKYTQTHQKMRKCIISKKAIFSLILKLKKTKNFLLE